MPDYVIIDGKTVVDANTDFVGRNLTVSGTVTIGNSSANTTLTANGVFAGTVGFATLAILGVGSFGNTLSITSNTTTTVNATANSGVAGLFTSSTNTAVRAVSVSGTGASVQSTSNIAGDFTSSSNYAGRFLSTTNSAIFAQSTSSTATTIRAISSAGHAITGESTGGFGALGSSVSGIGVYGVSTSNYGLSGISNTAHGIYGKTTSASSGAVIGFSSNNSIFGVLGHANAYSFYGTGTLYNVGNATVQGSVVVTNGAQSITINPTGIATSSTMSFGNTVVNGTLTTGPNLSHGSGFNTAALSASSLAVSGGATISGAINTSGKLTSNWSTGPVQLGSGSTALEIQTPNSAHDPFMTFHRVGSYAVNLGLRAADNQLAVGGYSMGAASYKLWTEANFNPGAYLPLSGGTVSSLTVGGGLAAYISMWDSDFGIRSLHLNTGLIGFLTSAGGWALYVDDSGNTTSVGNITAYSDIKHKEDIETVEGLSIVENLRGVRYTRKTTGERNVGVIAQEVQEYLPEVVKETPDGLAVDYGNITAVLIEAVKDLSSQVKALQAKVNDLEAR
jgi:hypothetical protein